MDARRPFTMSLLAEGLLERRRLAAPLELAADRDGIRDLDRLVLLAVDGERDVARLAGEDRQRRGGELELLARGVGAREEPGDTAVRVARVLHRQDGKV